MGNSTEWSHGAVGKTAPFASRGSSMLRSPLGGRSVGRSCTKPKSMSTWARRRQNHHAAVGAAAQVGGLHVKVAQALLVEVVQRIRQPNGQSRDWGVQRSACARGSASALRQAPTHSGGHVCGTSAISSGFLCTCEPDSMPSCRVSDSGQFRRSDHTFQSASLGSRKMKGSRRSSTMKGLCVLKVGRSLKTSLHGDHRSQVEARAPGASGGGSWWPLVRGPWSVCGRRF
eukprot:scaffold112580_cov72-Phaeocystis_antarctica.AAC.2